MLFHIYRFFFFLSGLEYVALKLFLKSYLGTLYLTSRINKFSLFYKEMQLMQTTFEFSEALKFSMIFFSVLIFWGFFSMLFGR